jgi:deoxyribose-phosphate aldolase
VDRETLELIVRCLDVTSLSGDETEADIKALCGRAASARVAAVVVLPRFIPAAKQALDGSGVKVASVAAFPEGDGPLDERLAELRNAVEEGADEIDVVLNRTLLNQPAELARELLEIRNAAGTRTLKVILETGALKTSSVMRKAAMYAMSAGADFIKSSTGKLEKGVTPQGARAMAESIKDFEAAAVRRVGLKLSGGIRTAKDSAEYVELVRKALGDEWLTPDLLRIGASSLLDDRAFQKLASAR